MGIGSTLLVTVTKATLSMVTDPAVSIGTDPAVAIRTNPIPAIVPLLPHGHPPPPPQVLLRTIVLIGLVNQLVTAVSIWSQIPIYSWSPPHPALSCLAQGWHHPWRAPGGEWGPLGLKQGALLTCGHILWLYTRVCTQGTVWCAQAKV